MRTINLQPPSVTRQPPSVTRQPPSVSSPTAAGDPPRGRHPQSLSLRGKRTEIRILRTAVVLGHVACALVMPGLKKAEAELRGMGWRPGSTDQCGADDGIPLRRGPKGGGERGRWSACGLRPGPAAQQQRHSNGNGRQKDSDPERQSCPRPLRSGWSLARWWPHVQPHGTI